MLRIDQPTYEEQLLKDIGEMWDDPYRWVLYVYPWNQGELAGFTGPDEWQKGFLIEWGQEIKLRKFDGRNAVDPIQFSTVSGHGIGKSAVTGWVTGFIMSTRPFCKGIVTANTSPQLETKTWAEIAKWMRRSLVSHWFNVTTGRGAMKIVHREYPESWRCDGIAWREQAPEAFAGQHAANSTPFYIFDEASAIPQSIFEVAQGGTTDGEPMVFMFGNGTKNSGYFFESHHKNRHRWNTRQIDSRTSGVANKELLQKWIDDYGIDSDYVKVRVLGQFPAQGASQFISRDFVESARERVARVDSHDPILIGVDVARFGDDESVIRVRQGRDARSVPPKKFRGLDTMSLATKVVEIAHELDADAVFIDGGGVGGGVVDRCRQLNLDVIEVNSSFKPSNPDYRIKGDEMWGGMRDWLKDEGAIDHDQQLFTDLISREYFFDKKNHIALESKEDMKDRGLPSPNDADALALTFAYPVGPRNAAKGKYPGMKKDNDWDYDPYTRERVSG